MYEYVSADVYVCVCVLNLYIIFGWNVNLEGRTWETGAQHGVLPEVRQPRAG